MQPWVIVLFLVMLVKDQVAAASEGTGGSTVGGGLAEMIFGPGSLNGPWPLVTSFVPLVLLALIVQLLLYLCGKGLDTTGRMRYVALADRIVIFGRYAAIGLHALNVLVFGWLDAVRTHVGDLVLVDELIAVLPALLVIAAGWWSLYPIERRVRDAQIFRQAEEGRTVWPTPMRSAFVWWNFRHHAMFILVSMLLITAWVEICSRVKTDIAAWLGLKASDSADMVFSVMQLIGVAAVFTFSPLVVRVAWDTVPLREGALRDRLVEMCRKHKLKMGGILIWRTHGTLVNAAAIGLLPPIRYILISDALIDLMPRPQVEAVMAHEIAHVRLKHIPWLAGSMLAASGIIGMAIFGAATLLARANSHPSPIETIRAEAAAANSETKDGNALDGGGWLGIGSAFFVVGGALMFLGFVSRRMEWQADAFAAKQLTLDPPRAELVFDSGNAASPSEPSGVRSPGLSPSIFAAASTDFVPEQGSPRISPNAAHAMIGALQAVAQVSHIPPARWSWRHGSIASRQRRLRDLIGMPVDRLPIDRHVAWIKRGVGLALLGLLAVAMIS